MILNALRGDSLPIYSDGQQIRDWLHIDDHARALLEVVTKGKVGETYNIGGHNKQKNLHIVQTPCTLLEELVPQRKPANINRYADLITVVKNRPGYDTRYAINATKTNDELGWKPGETFETGIRKTLEWYLDKNNV